MKSGRAAEVLAGTAAGPAEAYPPDVRASEVREMFERIAGVYDVMNTAMTAGLHHRWRARASELAGVGPGDRVLDVASGTGDLAFELARRVSPGGEVVGCDFSDAMLTRARAKAVRRAGGAAVVPRFERADALELPYEDASFDAATVGFGARNFSDLGLGLREMARVVRTGGRVVVLEITTPTRQPLAGFYGLWFDRLVPALGAMLQSALAAGARARGRTPAGGAIAAAYSYLPSSVKRFPGPEALAAQMRDAGLEHVSYLLVAGGIIALHAATVPAGAPAMSAGAPR
jgi:demethylmenaquinone methyltransferase/2-methoxy-6-polyprenyl-1,4-benzoquinol methylase